MTGATRAWLDAMPPTVLVAALLVVFAASLAGAKLYAWRERSRRRRAAHRRQRAASQGEQDAGEVLAQAGYRVVASQVDHTWTMWVDGQPSEVALRADFVVQRRGRRFVADAKTGDVAPNPTSSATRRQLLEYRLAYDVDGVLLVDMEQRRVFEVTFDEPPAWRRGGWALPWALGAASGLALVWLLSRAQAAGWVSR